MATKCELPEEINQKLQGTLGKEVEMQTFKSNFVDSDEDDRVVKITCVGDYTGGLPTKQVFIDDYLQARPTSGPLLTYLKRRSDELGKPIRITIRTNFAVIDEQVRFWNSNMAGGYFKGSVGALVFWGPRNSSSLNGVPKWVASIKEVCPSIPCVLITDNVASEPMQLIGPEKIFENEIALDQFCKDHGFVGHFEIKYRDCESGEKSVFGQAVNCLLEEILQNENSVIEEILQKELNITESLRNNKWMSRMWHSIKPRK